MCLQTRSLILRFSLILCSLLSSSFIIATMFMLFIYLFIIQLWSMERVAAAYIHDNQQQCNKCYLFSPGMPAKWEFFSYGSLLIYPFKAMKLQERKVTSRDRYKHFSYISHVLMSHWNLRLIFFAALGNVF